MNKLTQLDENLPEEFLDENACALNINVSLNIERNMSSSPFRSKATSMRQIPPSAAQFNRREVCPRSSKKTSGTTKQLSPFSEDLLPEKIKSEGKIPASRLQSDIKKLLKIAVQMRSQSNSCSGVEETPIPVKECKQPPRLQLAKEFTIHEVQSAKCFSDSS
ncbi:unnamed protein product [Moneuplotes crassus]|uniref:Uncharacterized protein n=1 Tax=Euplotes crassus TaxID=5936 RepID=A0AAD1Y527_EUPCR|nr:unnamed protein product [Moneuplotes crassus]